MSFFVDFLDFWTSQISGFHWLWNFWIPLFQDSWSSGCRHFRILQILDFRISGFVGSAISAFLDWRISRFPDSWISYPPLPHVPHDAMLVILSKSSRRFGFHTTTASTLQNWGEGGGALRRWSFSSQTPDKNPWRAKVDIFRKTCFRKMFRVRSLGGLYKITHVSTFNF